MLKQDIRALGIKISCWYVGCKQGSSERRKIHRFFAKDDKTRLDRGSFPNDKTVLSRLDRPLKLRILEDLSVACLPLSSSFAHRRLIGLQLDQTFEQLRIQRHDQTSNKHPQITVA
ncbi:hypothetical protein CGGC5_v004606 [Colletotrichum fructicola Nara gc5]|uniref:Uncharacterized protein n=1 Tax=Colletotrichum fructicola (strain Nara gc5) TaxID=1213859 RepID=A0A7J6JIS7_COLFN|nr:hypothetical protein CGGC5_v004606 [Colletotrichum fructicola Nara gc5]